MGPRSCERGNHFACGIGWAILGASMGPRSCERGNVGPLRINSIHHSLQWGRARASAEIWRELWFWPLVATALQWGRARASAEMQASWDSPRAARGLQWGRARASAEISGACGRRFRSGCFNGAALVRARKCQDGSSYPGRNVKLQWGRARASAEIPVSLIHSCGAPQCFNGAALVRARKYYDCGKNWQKLGELQWGRARASAEMGPQSDDEVPF